MESLDWGQHRKSASLLKKIIDLKGIDIVMASAIFRFKNPRVFQIIDKHAYRALFNKKLLIYPSSNVNRKIEIYFNYIDELIKLCDERNLEFSTIDRLLYVFDIKLNGKL